MLNYVLFGTGTYYKKYIGKIRINANIVAILDNNYERRSLDLGDIEVHCPDYIKTINYDRILLLAENISARQMYNQLVSLGVDKRKIQFVDEFFSEHFADIYEVFRGKNIAKQKIDNHNICILTIPIDYDGSSIAICQMARTLASTGNNVSIIAADVNDELLKNLTDSGVDVVSCPEIGSPGIKIIEYIKKYDICIINTFLMIDAVIKCRAQKRIIWWLHEAAVSYQKVFARYPDYMSVALDNVEVYAVSAIAQKNFNAFFPNKNCEILPYALHDYLDQRDCNKIKEERKDGKKLVFAMIASYAPLKAQKEFLTASEFVEEQYPDTFDVWLIGRANITSYARQVLDMAEKRKNVIVLGEKKQEEIQELYKEIDVIVCPSYEETMSIVVTEGFMNSKPCIISDNTGSALYVHNRIDGLICKAGDVKSLVDCMEWCLRYRNNLDQIGKRARMIYEKHFTENLLKERIESVFKTTI